MRETARPSRMLPSSRSPQSKIRSSYWSTPLKGVAMAYLKTSEVNKMAKVLVLYYSAYGHIEAMAKAMAEGAREAGAHVEIKRVPELVPEDIARKSHYKL